MNDTENARTADWLTYMQNSGYRITRPLRTIVELLSTSPHALSPLDVYDLGRQEYPRLGLVTVYRTLEKLEELGLVQRVHQPGGCHRYLRATQGHEHLLVCTACGHTFFFKGDNLSLLIKSVSETSGFQVQEHWLQLFGLCAECCKS